MNIKYYKISALTILVFNLVIGGFYLFHPNIIYDIEFSKFVYIFGLIVIFPFGFPFMGFLMSVFIERSFKGFALRYMYFMMIILSIGIGLSSIYHIYTSFTEFTSENLYLSAMFLTLSLALINGYLNRK